MTGSGRIFEKVAGTPEWISKERAATQTVLIRKKSTHRFQRLKLPLLIWGFLEMTNSAADAGFLLRST